MQSPLSMETQYKGSPHLLNLPGDELFINTRDDVKRRIDMKRKKNYKDPKDMTNILRAKINKI